MIYIDCTSTYSINILTGIQRVVYNIVEKGQEDSAMTQYIQPVVFSSRGFLPIASLVKHDYTVSKVDKPSKSKKKVKSFSAWIELLRLRRFPHIYQSIKKIFFSLQRKKLAKMITAPSIVFEEYDTLLFLDACWGMPIWDELKKVKSSKAKIVFVIYDLIPIRFPQFCDKPHTKEFKKFFLNSLDFADMYIGISQTVMKEVQVFIQELRHERAEKIKYDYFYLGADFSTYRIDEKVRYQIKDFFQEKTPVFLTVSTLEPRKNHALILEAFEYIWAKGINVKLCFIGKVGWKIEALVNKIKTHKMLGTQFMVFYDANDFELTYAYTHAHSLIFASFAEGFGLPIIESMYHGLPVLASSLPIHKEIGGDDIAYFWPDESSVLIDKITQMAQKPKEIIKLPWIGWQESANMLWNKIV